MGLLYVGPAPRQSVREPWRKEKMAKESFDKLIEQFAQSRRIMMRELGKVIIGQREVLDQMFAAIIARSLLRAPTLKNSM